MNLRIPALLLIALFATRASAKEDPTKPYAGSAAPALAPEEAQKHFKVPPGFEVRLFAAEPDQSFYPITDTPDGPKAGAHQTLLTAFGLEDKHELLNSFCWGPDGWMYFTQGVFTHSKSRHP